MTPKHSMQVSVSSDSKSKPLTSEQLATKARLILNNKEQAIARLRLISIQVDALIEAADSKKVSYISRGNNIYG